MNTTTPENVRCELKVEESELKLQLANMEGKLEALTAEYTKVLEERNKLNDKIEIYENKSEVSVECDFRAEMQHELKNLREKEASLENTIANLQHVNDDKDVQVKDVEEKLKSSQFCVQNLQETLVALEGEVMSKTGGVEALEKELKALKNALEESRVHYEESFQEKSMLSSNVSTLMNAKSWLMKQLEATKETQVKFQLELSEYESALLAQNKQVEVLKCDNAKVVQKLGQTQEKAIKEKAMILEHLEKVEKDLLNQDVTLRKIQTEKNTVQRELTVKIHALQQENNLLENLAKSARKIEEELQALKIDAASKEALLNKLNKEKKEVIEQLTRARNVNEVCDKNIKVLHSKLMENDKKLESLVNEQANKENTIQELKRENAVLTESIREAQEEKDGLDSAVQMLRLELDKVERRFKIMKRELTLKKNLLEEVTKQKDSFINELRALREDLEQHKSLMEALRDTIRQRDETIRSLQSDKEKVHAEARVLSENLKKTQMAFDETHKEKESLCEQLQASSSDLSNAERKLYDSCSEKAKLEGELESTKHALEDYANIKQAERESLKQEMDQLQSAFQYEATRHRDEAISLKQEVEFMKSQLSQRNTQYKNEVECLEKKLTKIAEAKEEEHVNIKKHCENKVNEVLEKTERERSKNIQEMLALNQEKKLLTIKCTELEERARNAAAMQQNRINSLEKELQTARGVIEEQKRELEKRLMLSIELEREKGRLAGLKTSQKALREHCKNVEQLSSKRQSKITELQTKLDNVSLEKEREEKEAKNKVNLLETTIKTQGERIDELRMRLTSERKETSQLQVKLDESEHEAENILKKLTKTCVELENTSEKYENCVQELQDSKQHHHELRGKLQSAQILVQKLENNDKLLNEREKVKDDLLKGLEWKLNQRSKELDYAKEQLRLADERHQSELETLKTAVQVANSEAVYLRREVFMARKAKTENQEKYFTSRDELLAARQETEVAKQDIFAASQQLRYLKSAILNSCDVKELQEFVKNDDNTASFVTKVTLMKPANQDDPGLKSSLSSLRECMASLRDQISTLQEQMNDHTAAICTTASSWRSFEKNVQTLQTECAAVQRKAQLCPAEKDTVES